MTLKDHWAILKRRFTKLGGDPAVTKRALSLGDTPHRRTGWFGRIWTESSDEVIILPKNWSVLLTGTGRIVTTKFMGVTTTSYSRGDQLYDSDSVYYVIRSVLPWKIMDQLIWYELALEEVPSISILTKATVELDSLAVAPNTQTNLGTIAIDASGKSLPSKHTMVFGDYAVEYTPAACDSFSSWDVSGGVTVANSTANPTTMTVKDNGTLRARFNKG